MVVAVKIAAACRLWIYLSDSGLVSVELCAVRSDFLSP